MNQAFIDWINEIRQEQGHEGFVNKSNFQEIGESDR